jgi:glutathione S-transferase
MHRIDPMIKLYYLAPQDCSGKVRWLLEEMNQPVESVKLDWRNGDLKSPAYLAKHPIGQVPLLEDGSVVLYESYAIVAYLADKFPGFAPPVSNLPARGLYYQWLFFSVDTAADYFKRQMELPNRDEEYRKHWSDHINTSVQRTLGAVEAQLKGHDYILGAFSAVDPCLAYAIDMISNTTLLKDYPGIQAWFERCQARPACIRSGIFDRSE